MKNKKKMFNLKKLEVEKLYKNWCWRKSIGKKFKSRVKENFSIRKKKLQAQLILLQI